jgi:hypothetical protein
MTRRFFNLFILAAILFEARISAQAYAGDLIKSSILENDVAYLRVGAVGKNLADEIQSAQSALTRTNKTVGTVLDLRFADGDDFVAVQTTVKLFASKKSPLAILVNGETRGAAVKLAADLRAARAGLIFGNSTEVKPDIPVKTSPDEERAFMENPFGTLPQNETNSDSSTNSLLPFVDHTTEADLVRAKIKDGDEDESIPPHVAEPQQPFIRDPVLARAVDLIKGLAVVRQWRS